MKRQLQKIDARESILDFTVFTFPKYRLNWHNRTLASYLDKFVNCEIPFLIIELPPRHGKSELVSRRLPAFVLGKDPDEEVIGCSYAASLASKMNRDVQRIIETPAYSELFPDTKIAGMLGTKKGEAIRNNEEFEIINHMGSYRSSGVGGGITGRGMTCGIIDDYCKNAEEAGSETYRNKAWEWYTSTFFTRLEEFSRVLITATRWDEDDLIGRVLKSEHGNRWKVVKLKALREDEDNLDDPRKEGEALWPDKFNEKRLNEIKVAVGTKVFTSLYQQEPSVSTGNIFKRDSFKTYKELPLSLNNLIIQSWDTDFGKNAATSAGVTGVLHENGLYITGLFDESLEFPQLVNQVKFEHSCNHCHVCLIEDKASGQSLIQQLRRDTIIPVYPMNPEANKEARAHAESSFVEAGNVYLPENEEWTKKFLDVLCKFPQVKRKDIVDAFTQLLKYCREHPANNKFLISSAKVRQSNIRGF